MSGSTLMLHRGGHVATRDQVAAIAAPPATETWHPVTHIRVLTKIEELLGDAGYIITRHQLALSHHGNRFFGVLDLESRIVEGTTLSLGLRNSIDKSFPYGLAGGTRTFCCDNLALTGDWDELTISRKHTRFGEVRFTEALANGIRKLAQYRDMESRRIERMRATEITDMEALGFMAPAFEEEIISPKVLKAALHHWRSPAYDWGPPTLWRLYNALNTPLQKRATSNPQMFSYQTVKLMEPVVPKGGDEPGMIDVTPAADVGSIGNDAKLAEPIETTETDGA